MREAYRIARYAKFGGLLAAAWCVMTFTHESGHLIGGWLSGAELAALELRPWHLPYSLFRPDPQPLVTLWAGPLLGVVVPQLLAMLLRQQWWRFIANFCLIANGSYIAVGWFSGDAFLDTTRLIDQGAHPALVACYCLVTIPIGYIRFRSDCVRLFTDADAPVPPLTSQRPK